MAGTRKAPASTGVSVVLDTPQEKKNTVRYDADKAVKDPAMTTAYVSKAALAKIGNPDKIKITIEAA
jgi:Cu/Ag efflux protein CusF